VIIHALIQDSIDMMIAEELSASAPTMSSKARKQLLDTMASLPEPVPMKEAVNRELQMMIDFYRADFFKDIDGHIKELIESMRMGTIISPPADGKEFDPKPYEDIGTLAKRSPDQFRIHLKEMSESAHAFGEVFEGDHDKAEHRYQAWVKRLNMDNPLVQHLLRPSTDERLVGTALSSLHAAVDTAMLRAGLSYLETGDAALELVLEPGSNKAFELVKAQSGFELRSRTLKMPDGAPRSLTFGRTPVRP
jgi:hypothetical protein